MLRAALPSVRRRGPSPGHIEESGCDLRPERTGERLRWWWWRRAMHLCSVLEPKPGSKVSAWIQRGIEVLSYQGHTWKREQWLLFGSEVLNLVT